MALFDRSNINPQAEMSFLGHLEALRWHLVRAVGVVMVLALTWFFLKELLFDGILLAPKNPQFLTYRVLCHLSDRLQLGEDLCIREIPFRLIAAPGGSVISNCPSI